MSELKIGDIVEMNREASHYSFTTPGTQWVVYHIQSKHTVFIGPKDKEKFKLFSDKRPTIEQSNTHHIFGVNISEFHKLEGKWWSPYATNIEAVSLLKR